MEGTGPGGPKYRGRGAGAISTPPTRFELTTARLRLVPLALDDLRLAVRRPAALARRLGVRAPLEPRSAELGAIFEAEERRLALEMEHDRWAFLWHVWAIIGIKERRMVGSLMFKGRPTESGQVELGYSLDRPYRGRGYMSEAVDGVTAWALEQPHVLAVLAETDDDNIASHRVLERCGFRLYLRVDRMWWWRRLRGQPTPAAGLVRPATEEEARPDEPC